MATLRTIDELDVCAKRVLVRVDFNAPVENGIVTDDTRLRAALPTINHLLDQDARVILMSHRGRPAGKGYEEDFSLAPIARRLEELLGRPVQLAHDVTGPDAGGKADDLRPGEVLLLENLRFDPREEERPHVRS